MSAIGVRELADVADHVRRRSAIVLDETKGYLVESRLQGLARQLQLPSVAPLVAAVRTDPNGRTADLVVQALTTNETSWFRDQLPFDALRRHVLPRLARLPGQVTIWSAACSTGQEAYSIAMTIHEHAPELAGRTTILGSDLSEDVVERAREGVYSDFEIRRGLDEARIARWFRRCGKDHAIDPRLRSMVQFRTHNLVGSWASVPLCDVVFLRNVLIYFDLPTKQAVLSRVRGVLRPGGQVLLGASESTFGIDDDLVRVAHPDGTSYHVVRGDAAV